MTEAALQRRIQRALRQAGCWVAKIHGSRYQRAGLPDLLVFRPVRREELPAGELVAVGGMLEVKPEGEDATRLQVAVMEELRESGVRSGVVRTPEEALAEMGVLW